MWAPEPYLDAYEIVQSLLGIDETALQEEHQTLHDAATDEVYWQSESKEEEPPPGLKI